MEEKKETKPFTHKVNERDYNRNSQYLASLEA